MKLPSSFVSFLLARLARIARGLQAAPALVPIPIRSERGARHHAPQRQRRRW